MLKEIGDEYKVSKRLTHLLALCIPDEAMDIDRVKRYLASEVAGHHDHARHPKENDVKAGNQY